MSRAQGAAMGGQRLVVVLVEPAGPLNVGSVARLIANFSSADLAMELRLVAPRCDHRGDEAQRMAVHGRAVLERASLYGDLAAAVADCGAVLATSGRGEGEPLPVLELDAAMQWLQVQRSQVQRSQAQQLQAQPSLHDQPAALVFGREDRGLSAAELLQAGALLQISTGGDYRSLNLSHAVALVLHALHQAQRQGGTFIPAQPALAPRGAVEAMLSDAEALLLDVGFLYPHTAAARMAKLRALLQRAGLQAEEVALLRGMVRQCRWAAGRSARTS